MKKLLYLMAALALLGCASVDRASRGPHYYQAYQGAVVGTTWDMLVTIYTLQRGRLPDNLEVSVSFASQPVNGAHLGTMTYRGRQVPIMAQITSLRAPQGPRPTEFLLCLDPYQPRPGPEEGGGR